MQEAKSYSTEKKDFSYTPEMDTARQLIVDKAKELDETLASLSEQIGRNHAYLQQFIKRGIPAALPERERGLLAPLLGVPEESLRGPEKATLRATAAPRNAKMGERIALQGTVPAYGHAAGGRDGQFPLNGNKVADLLAPPRLASIPDAYAVYVAGNSMEPRYYAGEAVFVNPRLPVRRGDFVVAQIAAGEGDPPDAYVKRFISRDAKFLKLEQFNPRKQLRFLSRLVVSVHRIIMAGND